MPGRPLSERRLLGDRILIAMLKDGPRKAGDVIAEFVKQGLSKDDYRASRNRLGAKVGKNGKTGPKGRISWVWFAGNRPLSKPSLCSPRRLAYRMAHNEEIETLRLLLKKQIQEVDTFLGKLKGTREVIGCDVLPVAGFDGQGTGDVAWREERERLTTRWS